MKKASIAVLVVAGCCVAFANAIAADSAKSTSKPKSSSETTKEWTMWGGSPERNNTPEAHNIPTEWNIGEVDYRTGKWDSSKAKNVKWVAQLGSQTYGNAVVADGHV